MFPGYHFLLREHAFRTAVLSRTADIPDFRLAIGAAEDLSGQPVRFRLSDAIKPTRVIVEEVKSIDDVKIDGQGKMFSEDDFPKTGYIGGIIGGF